MGCRGCHPIVPDRAPELIFLGPWAQSSITVGGAIKRDGVWACSARSLKLAQLARLAAPPSLLEIRIWNHHWKEDIVSFQWWFQNRLSTKPGGAAHRASRVGQKKPENQKNVFFHFKGKTNSCFLEIFTLLVTNHGTNLVLCAIDFDKTYALGI